MKLKYIEKKLLSLMLLIGAVAPVISCPVCERNKSSVLSGLTHGVGSR